MPIKVQVRGLDEVKYVLEGYNNNPMVGIVTEAAAAEVVAIMQEQPEETPAPYVSRAKAYPDADYRPGYFSAKQHRYVMALLRRIGWDGKSEPPKYERTGKLSGAWKIEGKLSRAKAVNQEAAAEYVFGKEKQQANHEKLVGWQAYPDRLDEKSNRILDAAYLALAKERERREKK